MKRSLLTFSIGANLLSVAIAHATPTEHQLRYLSPLTSLTNLKSLLTPPSENIQLLKDIFNKQISTTDDNLNRASSFLVHEYPKGNSITQNECNEYESRVSHNYSLHSYTDSDGTEKTGVKLCPPSQGSMGLFDGEWINPSTTKYSYSHDGINNILDVKGVGVLSIEYETFSFHTKVTRQYVLDSQFKMIEFTESRTEKGHQFWTIISAADQKGNILAKVEKTWDNPNESYLWKRIITFIPATGELAKGMRYYQNDGKGIEVEKNSYLMPYNWHWDAYEVSPYTRVFGLYKVNGKITDWPKMQVNFDTYKNAKTNCEEGYIGFDEHGNFIRVFGNIWKCASELDVNTTRS